MGKSKSNPPPAQQLPAATPIAAPAATEDPSINRAAALKAQDAETARASLLDQSGSASSDVDPLSEKKTLTAGSAGLMG